MPDPYPWNYRVEGETYTMPLGRFTLEQAQAQLSERWRKSHRKASDRLRRLQGLHSGAWAYLVLGGIHTLACVLGAVYLWASETSVQGAIGSALVGLFFVYQGVKDFWNAPHRRDLARAQADLKEIREQRDLHLNQLSTVYSLIDTESPFDRDIHTA